MKISIKLPKDIVGDRKIVENVFNRHVTGINGISPYSFEDVKYNLECFWKEIEKRGVRVHSKTLLLLSDNGISIASLLKYEIGSEEPHVRLICVTEGILLNALKHRVHIFDNGGNKIPNPHLPIAIKEVTKEERYETPGIIVEFQFQVEVFNNDLNKETLMFSPNLHSNKSPTSRF